MYSHGYSPDGFSKPPFGRNDGFSNRGFSGSGVGGQVPPHGSYSNSRDSMTYTKRDINSSFPQHQPETRRQSLNGTLGGLAPAPRGPDNFAPQASTHGNGGRFFNTQGNGNQSTPYHSSTGYYPTGGAGKAHEQSGMGQSFPGYTGQSKHPNQFDNSMAQQSGFPQYTGHHGHGRGHVGSQGYQHGQYHQGQFGAPHGQFQGQQLGGHQTPYSNTGSQHYSQPPFQPNQSRGPYSNPPNPHQQPQGQRQFPPQLNLPHGGAPSQFNQPEAPQFGAHMFRGTDMMNGPPKELLPWMIPPPERNIELYRVLGLTSSATDEEILNSFKRIAFIHHPDKCTDGGEIFKKVNFAKSILTDTEKRKEYDRFRAQDRQSLKEWAYLQSQQFGGSDQLFLSIATAYQFEWSDFMQRQNERVQRGETPEPAPAFPHPALGEPSMKLAEDMLAKIASMTSPPLSPTSSKTPMTSPLIPNGTGKELSSPTTQASSLEDIDESPEKSDARARTPPRVAHIPIVPIATSTPTETAASAPKLQAYTIENVVKPRTPTAQTQPPIASQSSPVQGNTSGPAVPQSVVPGKAPLSHSTSPVFSKSMGGASPQASTGSRGIEIKQEGSPASVPVNRAPTPSNESPQKKGSLYKSPLAPSS